MQQAQRNLPDQIVDLFLALIFIGDLKPGDRLPPELQLTKILRVNQSSLRMAMRVLVRMKVIKSTRGSGLVILDYKTQAGLNFMTELVRISELELGSTLLLEMLEGAPFILTQLMKSVTEHEEPSNNFEYLSVLDQQIKLLIEKESPKKIAELDIYAQNLACSTLKNPILRATFNSFMPLRDYILELYHSMGGERLNQIKNQKKLWIAFSTTKINKEQFLASYYQLVSDETNALRKYLSTLPKEPRLIKSPLQHYPELVSLANY